MNHIIDDKDLHIAYGVENFKGHFRYFYSHIKAELIAQQYGTNVHICVLVPKFLIEE